MSVSIKTVFDGNIHRFNLTKPSYDELEQALNSIYGKRGFSIRYQDEDGDMISVSSSLELQEALRVANGGTLKLILSQAAGDSFVCVDKKSAVLEDPPVVVHAETPKQAIEQGPSRETQVPKPEEKKQEAPSKLSCDEMRALACQFLSDPAVQLVLPDLAKAVIAQVVQEVRAKQTQAKDSNEAGTRVLEVITNHSVIQNHPAMAAVRPHLGQVKGLVARLIDSIPIQFVDVLDKLKDGFLLNADMLLSVLANPREMLSGGILDCGKFDLGALGLSLASLAPVLASLEKFSCGSFDLGFECKSPSPAENPAHDTVRCDGCNAFPIVGPRYNCTVCPDFDLCAACEASSVHPAEHPLLKLRQPVNAQVVHHGITCDGCQQSPIIGIRFKCRTCPDFDLCESCETKNVHPANHPMIKFKVEKMRHGHGVNVPLHKLFHHGLFTQALHRGQHRSRWLSRGAVGDAVKEIQHLLKIQVDGYFGAKTEQAVKDFQASHSLEADGIVGPRTRAKLVPEKQVLEKEAVDCGPKPMTSWWLARGAVGESVKEIQHALGIQPDGFFGPRTEQAVKEFQIAHSLDADGIVGPKTRAQIALGVSVEKKDVTSGVATEVVPPSPAMAHLISMGFIDQVLNAELLKKHNNDVEQVVADFVG